MNKRIILVVFIAISVNVIGQESAYKEKFVSEKWLNIKIGSTINLTNIGMYKLLNESFVNSNAFTSTKSTAYNPLVELGFEKQFFKYFGLEVDFGFTQTRHNYSYNDLSSNYGLNNGSILCNIPNLNIRPTFYCKKTSLQVGLGLYKYYYSFKPYDVGNVHFDLNSEGLALYSSIGLRQIFNVKSYRFSATASYFGLTKKYDNGFQLALGIAI